MRRLSFLAIILMALTAACAANFSPEKAANEEAFAIYPAESPPEQVDSQAGRAYATDALVAPRQRMVIQNANLTLVVDDPHTTLAAIQRLAEETGGYVVSSNIYTTQSENGRLLPTAEIIIRVPAEQLDTVLQTIKAPALEVRNESIQGQDITAEYIDLESRLRSLQAAETQLEAMMTQATDMQDVIAIFDQLTYYREQIEQVRGQMQYYEQAVALSSIRISLLAAEGVLPLNISGWNLGVEARRALQDLIYFVQGFLRFALRLVILYLPAAFLIAALGYGLWRSIFSPLKKWWQRLRAK